jgi:hypothetical protein
MGKKKAVKKAGMNPDRVPRKEPYSSQRMSAILDRIREQAARISALARSLEDAKIDQLVIDGHQMLLRGLNQIDNFIDNASRSVREAKTAKETL